MLSLLCFACRFIFHPTLPWACETSPDRWPHLALLAAGPQSSPSGRHWPETAGTEEGAGLRCIFPLPCYLSTAFLSAAGSLPSQGSQQGIPAPRLQQHYFLCLYSDFPLLLVSGCLQKLCLCPHLDKKCLHLNLPSEFTSQLTPRLKNMPLRIRVTMVISVSLL